MQLVLVALSFWTGLFICLFISMVSNAILSLSFGTVATEPVTLSEAKAWIKVADSYTDDDTIITALIIAARQILEEHLTISIASKTYTVVLKNLLGDMELPYGPIISITSAADWDGDALTIDEDYYLSGEDFKRLDTITDYIKFVYVAGYSTVPEALKLAIKMQVGYMYEHRGDDLDTLGISKDALMVAKIYSRNGIFI